MDIELLKTFLEVTHTRHFGRAADKLFITPAAVSARIRQLEQYLGVSLFYRTRGNIQMTAEGERLLPHAHQLLEGWAVARRDLAQESEPLARASLGALPALWQSCLSSWPRRLNEMLPEIGLRCDACQTNELVDRLRAGQLDVVLLFDLPGEADLKGRKVGQVPLQLFSRERETFSEALARGYISVDWGPAFALFQARRMGKNVPRLVTDQLPPALDLVRAGLGCVWLPQELTGLHRVVDAPDSTRSLYATFLSEREFTPQVQQLLQALPTMVEQAPVPERDARESKRGA